MLLGGGGDVGVKSVIEVTVNSQEKTWKTFVPITSKNSAFVLHIRYSLTMNPYNNKKPPKNSICKYDMTILHSVDV